MNNKYAISISGVSKKYTIGQTTPRYLSLREQIVSKLKSITAGSNYSKDSTNEFWALKDIHMNVNIGDVVGIIGKNGAGKSTLLKVVSRITAPTKGIITLNGRVASLLEVGTGFHPELTGRENIYLNGAILGMTRREIKKKFDDIVQFSGVERFLDTPVKRYSSGMYVRLAFSVAAHLDPEILIIDEVLSVGDAAFQKKCIGKMSSIATSGRTVLFVSHNMPAVQSLCDKAILLESGVIKYNGSATEVVSRYLESDDLKNGTTKIWAEGRRPSSDGITLQQVKVYQDADDTLLMIDKESYVDITIELKGTNVTMGATLVFTDNRGIIVFSSLSSHSDIIPYFTKSGIYVMQCRIPKNILNAIVYNVSVYIWTTSYKIIIKQSEILAVQYQESDDSRGNYFGEWLGTTRPKLDWNIKQK